MLCPNCGKEMKNKSYWYYGLGSWDMDYPDELHEEYRCTACKIKYENGNWTIPKALQATEKQINAAAIIECNTGIRAPAPVKAALWEYINKNMALSKQCYAEHKQRREQLFEEWCEDNSDWLPEYF